MKTGKIEGKNEIKEALKEGQTFNHVYALKGSRDQSLNEIINEIKNTACSISFVDKARLDILSETKHHQGIIAEVASLEKYVEVSDILEIAKNKNESPFMVMLDGIEDPHNLGAIIRTCESAGVHGLIIPKRGSAAVNETVVRTSAGASAHLPIARVGNLSQTIETLKKQGVWFVCGDMNGDTMYARDLTGAICLVLGNEGEGVSRLVRENCDFTVRIPMYGQISSLNVSVAGGILIYEIIRQRNFLK